VLERARDEDDADRHDRDGDERRAVRPLLEEEPREQPDEDDLRVAEHRGEAGSDVLDRVVPEDEVAGEEEARQPRERARAERPASPAPLLPDREREQYG